MIIESSKLLTHFNHPLSLQKCLEIQEIQLSRREGSYWPFLLYKNLKFNLYRKLAAHVFQVPYTTLQNCLDGRPNRPEKRANHGLCKYFIREQSLSDTSQVRNWFMWGQKLLRIEREIGIPGISLVLTCVLP